MDHFELPISHNLYNDLNESEYTRIFNRDNNVIGGALSDISVYERKHFSNIFKNNNSGAGIFSFLSGLAKQSLPYLKKIILPEAINFSSDLLHHKLQNRNIDKNTLKELTKKSLKNIAKKSLSDSSGGLKRKFKIKKKRKKITKKKNKSKKYKKKRSIKKRAKVKRKKKRKIKKRKKNSSKNKFSIFNSI